MRGNVVGSVVDTIVLVVVWGQVEFGPIQIEDGLVLHNASPAVLLSVSVLVTEEAVHVHVVCRALWSCAVVALVVAWSPVVVIAHGASLLDVLIAGSSGFVVSVLTEVRVIWASTGSDCVWSLFLARAFLRLGDVIGLASFMALLILSGSVLVKKRRQMSLNIVSQLCCTHHSP